MNEANQKSAPGQSQEPAQIGNFPPIPNDALIILPVRNTVLFPGVVLPFSIGRPQSIAAAQEAARSERPIGIVLQRDAEVEAPSGDELYRIGTQAEILRYMTMEDGTHHVVCRGDRRVRIIEFLPGFPFLVARIDPISRIEAMTPEVEARLNVLRERAHEAIGMLPNVPAEVANAIENITSPSDLADFVAGLMDFKPEEKQELLELIDIKLRLDKVLELLSPRIEVLKIRREIDEQMQQSISEQQRERLLREQLRTIQRKLGEEDRGAAEIAQIEEAIARAKMPPEAEEQARGELKRLQRMPEAAAEYGTIRTYLDWLAELPWSITEEAEINIADARRVLDEDHYGLEKIKRRIIEYLAVRKLSKEGRSPILCFVGPPGVGKTSLGQSIARAMGRKFIRVSLGGVHDEAEIRGHRRTYVGALPGNIIQAIRKAGSRDPVFMLDEMDKLGAGFHGDPSSALLEVLDPEQNSTFRDNYLGVPFDLSQVVFIGTANVLDNVPCPLRDRMEIIELPGYTEEEKLEIAKRYLVGRQLSAHGLAPDQCEITVEAVRAIIHDYTREAGCRNLERAIGSVLRSVAVRIADGSAQKIRVDLTDLPAILGPRKFESEVAMRTSVPGVATGLAWTPVGGDILFIEATRIPGSGKLILTGQLGEVMKESAQAALSLVKGHATAFGVNPEIFEKSDIHIHVPAGAIPKDGPSAGVAMFTALASLLTGKTVRKDTAMTGEISLRGLVLPIGGVKEKVLAAVRAGITTVLLPARNRKDLEDIPESARNRVRFVWLEHVDDALEAVLEGEAPSAETRKAGP
jgi:ATP-dependent Lon protease